MHAQEGILRAGLRQTAHVVEREIIEFIKFESKQPEFAGEMRMTVSVADAHGGTEVIILFEGIPKGIRPEDNEMGSKESLQKLAVLPE